jgi:hypothetical protein
MVLDPVLYEDSQTQNPALIPAQSPMPTGVQLLEISWDRRAGWMRAIIGQQSWHFKELLGKGQIISTDDRKGRIYIRAVGLMQGETLIIYRWEAPPHPVVEGIERIDSHQRLCYRRSHQDWRVRDERRPETPDALVFCNGYIGDLNVEWEGADPIAHIYHNGPIVIDDRRIAHLYDPDLVYD